MHRQIAGKLTGRVTKWLVLAFWIVMLVVFGGFAGKLSDVQDNQASSWLPSSAESTKALHKLEPFQDQNDIPTTVVYHRPSGLTDADLATIATQVGQIQELKGARPTLGPDGKPLPPQALIQQSNDKQVAQASVTFNFGTNGWNTLPAAAKQIRKIATIDGVHRPPRRAGRPGR